LLDAGGAIAIHEFLGQACGSGTAVILCGLRPDLLELVERVSHEPRPVAPVMAADYPTALLLSQAEATSAAAASKE